MKVYKPIRLIKDLSYDEITALSKLFSDDNDIIRHNEFTLLKYSPDTYFKNGRAIGDLFQSDIFEPLIMTNYKFLALLLVCSSHSQLIFSDFSFKKYDDGQEVEDEKYHVRSLLDEQGNVSGSFEFLKDVGQKIASVELKVGNSSDIVIVYSSGNIAFSDSISDNKKCILDIVQFLFTGRVK